MLKGFKDFILRGNVIDLAVAVVIGAAFGAIVTAFTSAIINPLVAAAGGADSPGLGFQLRTGGGETTFVNFGLVITAAINFLIVAAVVYFILVLPMNKLKERRERGIEKGPSEPTDVELLKEIRDLLAGQAAGAGADSGTSTGKHDRGTQA